MYKMYDRSEAIKEIQKYLQEIGISDTYIAPNGIYDEKTGEAVLYYQQERGLSPTGKVEKETFDKLYFEYNRKRIIDKTDEITRQNDIFPFKLGDYGEDIRVFNRLLKQLLDYYGKNHSLRDSAIYSDETESAHIEARRIFGLDSGVADQIFYNRLLKETESIRKISKSFPIE